MNSIHRRTFLALASTVPLWALVDRLTPSLLAQSATDRKFWWAPNTAKYLAIEWRYIAGRVTDTTQDYGFIISFNDIKYPQKKQQLLVQRQDFMDAQAYVGKAYEGNLLYTAATATYTFASTDEQAHGTMQWDEAAQVYRVSIVTPELKLENAVLTPRGSLIPEGGTGDITVGKVNIAPFGNVTIGSDYHADWAQVELNSRPVGTARIDMQGLRAVPPSTGLADTGPADYDHHWFAVAGELEGTPVWVSAWRIESQGTVNWDVTVAQISDSSWNITSFTEKSAVSEPLAVQVLEFQTLPQSADVDNAYTGMRWHITAGLSQAGDFDLELAVLPGQFIPGARLGEAVGIDKMEEAVGTVATGTIFGKPLSNVTLVVGETTAEFYLQQLPIVLK